MKILNRALIPLILLAGAVFDDRATAADIASHVVRTKIDGIDVLAYPTAVKDVVTIVGSLPAGDAFAGAGNGAVPTLVSMMLDRGTTTEDQFAIAQKLESVGAEIAFGAGPQMLSIQAKCLKKDAPLVIHLMAEELRSPAFAAAEFAKAQQQLEGTLKHALESTDGRAVETFQRAVFPDSHPNHPAATEAMLKAVEQASVEDVKRFYHDHYGPAHMTLVLVGDLDVPKLHGDLKKSFSGWTGGSAVLEAAKAPATAPAEKTVEIAGKTSVSVVIGQATGLRYRDPDTLALRVGTAIFGNGFTSRLMSTVRDKEGLTYGIGAGIGDDSLNDGDWRIRATFAPALLAKGLASTRRELLKWREQGITAQELAARKTNLIGNYEVGLATTDGMAEALLQAVERGYDVTWLDQYPKAIDALTLDQVNGAIRKYIEPDKMVLVKAGSV